MCQIFKEGKHVIRQFWKRVNINISVLTKITMNINYLPSSRKLYKHILVLERKYYYLIHTKQFEKHVFGNGGIPPNVHVHGHL